MGEVKDIVKSIAIVLVRVVGERITDVQPVLIQENYPPLSLDLAVLVAVLEAPRNLLALLSSLVEQRRASIRWQPARVSLSEVILRDFPQGIDPTSWRSSRGTREGLQAPPRLGT